MTQELPRYNPTSDVMEDIQILEYLACECLDKINVALNYFQNLKKFKSLNNSFETTVSNIQNLENQIKINIKTINETKNIAKKKDISPSEIDKFCQIKQNLIFLIRILNYQSAGAIASSDWQSPTFNHSITPLAGREIGKIKEAINDYKRDQHLDGYAYEQKFKKEYLANSGIISNIYCTNSGMSAFNTILNFLQSKFTNDREYIVVGKNAYWQIKDILISVFGKNIFLVDESDLNTIQKIIVSKNPKLFFFDTIGNTPDMKIIDLPNLIKLISKFQKNPSYLIIDNTSSGTSFNPLKYNLNPLLRINMICFESLNKYHQFGLDQTTGGIIYTNSFNKCNDLFTFRVHLGTMMSDFTSILLPSPNKEIFNLRLKRLSRNNLYIAHALQKHIDDNPNIILEKIIHPGLSNHPDNKLYKKINLKCAFFMLEFKPKFSNVKNYRKYLKAIINKSKNQKIELNFGTSFGLDNTRAYLTALRSKTINPFIRIAIGTENFQEVQKLVEIISP